MSVIILFLPFIVICHVLVFLARRGESVEPLRFLGYIMVHMLMLLLIVLPNDWGSHKGELSWCITQLSIRVPLVVMQISIFLSAITLLGVFTLLESHAGDYCREHPIVMRTLVVCSHIIQFLFFCVICCVISRDAVACYV